MRRGAAIAAALLFAGACDARKEQPGDTAVALPTPAESAVAAGREAGARPLDTISATTAAGMTGVDAGPTIVLAADSVAGERLFRGVAGCFTCHGRNAEGLSNLGPSLRDEEWLHGNGSFDMIARTIRLGLARPVRATVPMPAFTGRLSDADIFRVAAYTYTLSHAGAVRADTAHVPGDTMSSASPLDSTAQRPQPLPPY